MVFDDFFKCIQTGHWHGQPGGAQFLMLCAWRPGHPFHDKGLKAREPFPWASRIDAV
jgi:hypothetical protein